MIKLSKIKIKTEKDVKCDMSYEELIDHIKRGFDFRIAVGNNIEIDVFTLGDNKSVLCYNLTKIDEQIDICDIEFSKKDVETMEVYRYMTFKELFNTEDFQIIKMY